MHDLSKYIELIRSGEVVAFPTETVYGLGADAWNPAAIKKVFETKGRPSDNPLIVHVSNIEQVYDFANEIPKTAQKLMEFYWPGPLTIILEKKPKVLDLITAGLDTVALRMPDHPLTSELISQTGPLVAPSANRSGKPSPTKAAHVKNDFGENFPVIDGGATEIGLESTVVDLTKETPLILRPGMIGEKELSLILYLEVKTVSSMEKKPRSPGQKYSHYKPQATVEYGRIKVPKNDTLYLVQKEYDNSENIISYNGDLLMLSRELYDRFRQADLEDYSTIFIENIDDHKNNFPSFYSALLNRIQKAKG
ncbi:L-threonylcarbamoyladenylate synthase [Gracilimonas halophila]|uniref:Threonylcarbamoyl-AMP synthase n=1 Tax=Gracilimonas halophila TaxID=1834464 RepID=A0ABW5JLL4_9BACT